MRVFLGAFTCLFLVFACGCGGEELKTDPRSANQPKETKRQSTRTPDDQNFTPRGD
jgi:hypothetical protein